MNIVITGTNGLLGQTIVWYLRNHYHIPDTSIICVGRGPNRIPFIEPLSYFDLDICFPLLPLRPYLNEDTVWIHCAAMTHVDECEKKRSEAYKVNVEAVKHISDLCKSCGTFLVQLSTDFVFNGQNGPYAENDIPNPVNYYGYTKWEAEQYLIQHNPDSAIVRTILVYGRGQGLTKKNIVEVIIERLKNSMPLLLVNDQYRMPTYVPDLAKACIEVALRRLKGIYHVSGEEGMSIYEMGLKIAEILEMDKRFIQPVESDYFKELAPRPPRTGFILDKIKSAIGYRSTPFSRSVMEIAYAMQQQQ